MTGEQDFLADVMPRQWTPEARHGFQAAGLFVGKGANAIEVAVARSGAAPNRTALLDCWKARRAGRAAPVLLVVLHPGGAPRRADWEEARRKAATALGRRDRDLLSALGFQVERLDNLTELLRSGDRRTALAVMLRETESPEAGTARFNSLPPVSCALANADAESLSWVLSPLKCTDRDGPTIELTP
jgi:hypothetical protein